MFSDTAVLMGDAHQRQGQVCQDYAGSVPGLAAVSDGCSMSGSTDWGARLWVRAALSALVPDGEGASFPDRFGPVQARVQGWRQDLGLDLTDLDATLGVVTATPTGVQAWCWGDGVIAACTPAGVEAWVIDWAGNMPGYPSYLLDPDRQAQFIAASSEAARREQRAPCRVRHVLLGTEPTELDVWEQDAAEGLRGFGVSLDQADVVLVMSDGVEQVEGVSWTRVVSDLIAVKAARQGAFITRRLLRASKAWGPPIDDLSVAALAMGPARDQEDRAVPGLGMATEA